MNSLDTWQKKQATLLYMFASHDYLKELYQRVHQLQDYADALLNKSLVEGRDQFLRDAKWGDRNTSENWSNNAWAFLADFGLSLTRDLADRQSQIYRITGANQCSRAMSEFSMEWTTPAEQKKFDDMFESISNYAGYIDSTMDKFHRAGRWNDFRLSIAWAKHSSLFSKLPIFKVHEDIEGETGKIPPKTGVYISTGHPNATLQFAWNGDEHGKLRECAIFNRLGESALATVGRSKLWLDGDAMLKFVLDNQNSPELREDSYFAKSHTPVLAPSLVGRNAFTSAPSKWCYIELLPDEFEPIAAEADQFEHEERRLEAGQRCEVSGFYFTPASPGSRRYIRQGDILPKLDSSYGDTIWQWDQRQE